MSDYELSKDNVVEFIGDIFLRRGAESYIGEAVTMSEHMLQSAKLAEDEGADSELIAAALLHDIGHYTSEFGADAHEDGIDNHHEAAGAAILARFFPQVIVDCVRYHVAAKRYLCAVEPDYFDALSDASVLSLQLQGGPMSDDEVAEFESYTNLDAIIRVRRWDEQAKVPGLVTPDFESYKPILESSLR
ncbi:MAG: HD domain-containing protein [Pseudomonadota bacterium]